ncbi:hypothetical protein [Georgenia sp. AZ-5]|uniref:hypothetical protein n=1 Tax=Georgenia sp. AZ-5 TaxID=3367526 RepID=UPI0037550E14
MTARPAAALAGLAVLAGALLGPALPAGATPTSRAATSGRTAEDAAPAGPVQTGPGVPADVAEWFTSQAGDAVAARGVGELDVTVAERGELRPGVVRTVMTWSEGLVQGTDVTPPTRETDHWIAPLLLDGSAVGALVAAREDGAVDVADVSGDTDLAEELQSLPLATHVVHDVPLDAWFTVEEGEVSPLDAAARDSLAGAVPVEVYQRFVEERHATGDADEPGSAAPQPQDAGDAARAVAWVAAGAAALLVWAGIQVWLRRPEEPGRERARRSGAGGRRSPRRPSPDDRH